MRPLFLFLICTILSLSNGQAQPYTPAEIARWKQQAAQITITRDKWGVAHIYGKTDADVVFGTLYAQCEDDFPRVEMNYIDAIGRLAEVEGESALYHDLRARMFMDTTQAVALYAKSPAWMKKLLNAFADGTNYYLYTHPQAKPRLIWHFEPWMPLMFSEGSIGGNISAVSIERIKAFYENRKVSGIIPAGVVPFEQAYERESVGSNGFAIAPAKSASGNALLLINPHTSFYFRSEVQMVSRQGLNAYGAVTWGQFFIYQGFNEHCGWMHTTSYADVMDEYLETIENDKGKLFYRYGSERRPVTVQPVTLRYRTGDVVKQRAFTIYKTHHGPVVGEQDGKWMTLSMMNDGLNALMQSYGRTKATGYASYRKVMKLNGNASNNTIFADRKGNIAYWHGNFMPKRSPNFDWDKPVDGSNPDTDWRGLHDADEIVQVKNPATGWIQNCNATPFTVSGSSSPSREQYPAYMAPDAENYRGLNAVRVLSSKTKFTLDTLISAANDPHLTAFDALLPALLKAYDAATELTGKQVSDVRKAIEVLRAWNGNYGTESVGTTLAILWAEKMQRMARPRATTGQRLDNLGVTDLVINSTSAVEKIRTLAEVVDELERDFGKWNVAWGEMNRFQRLTGKIQETYDDNKPSLPVGFTPSAWGSLAAFGARSHPNTKKRYGYVGNSFVAVVEFGKRVKARSVMAGGQSNDPKSAHFTDQAGLYTQGQFKDVLFYPEDVQKHVERSYHPGF
jgi:acyl-homoserine-lactone acylase